MDKKDYRILIKVKNNMTKYCCTQMKKSITFDCALHSDVFDCPDNLVNYTPMFDEYGLIVHDGGTSCQWLFK